MRLTTALFLMGFKITNDPADLSNGQLNTSLLNNSKKVISVYLTNSSSDEILAVGKLKVPRDLIVRNYDNLINWEKGEFNRVFLDSKNIIYTNGRTLNLETNTLIAFNRARIDTFKPSQKAGKGSKGRNGGVITIKAKKAIGEAYITLRGEQGGDGIEPPSQYNNPNYRGVKGPTGEPGEDGSAGRGEFSFCRKQPTNGGQGGKGKSGFKGQRGFPGGLSGSLLINVDDAREFQVTVSMEKSKGGAGSVGGRGGRGGEGGEPGRNNTSECKKASMGPEGPPGERGSRGEDGVFGKTEHYCLKLGSENAVICTE